MLAFIWRATPLFGSQAEPLHRLWASPSLNINRWFTGGFQARIFSLKFHPPSLKVLVVFDEDRQYSFPLPNLIQEFLGRRKI